MHARAAEIAVIGAGPAGAHLASRLAADGRDVVLFDPKGAWEKPCGGGVPTRAIREFSFILESSQYPRKLVRKITMISPLDRQVTLTLDRPFAVYSRQVLNGLVLDRAIEAGAQFVREGVSDFSRERNGWIISTEVGNQWRVRFLVGADGAASFTRRRLVGIFPKQDLALAFGYNIKCEESAVHDTYAASQGASAMDRVLVRFPKDLTGYLWAFPRPGVMNFGIFAKLDGANSIQLRELLLCFVKDHYGGSLPAPEITSFFAAKLPMLDPPSWRNLRTVGERWALIGDAAGFADPITGEGIYYAFKSAELLADALGVVPHREGALWRTELVQTAGDYDRMAALYVTKWRCNFGRELEQASLRLHQFYHGKLFGRLVTDVMILLARHHPGLQKILGRALIGEQSYTSLKQDVISHLLGFY